MDEERLPYGITRVNCECCGLTQRQRDRDGAIPNICDQCTGHQGSLPERQSLRAEVHETMLRERLDACRSSEARAQKLLARAKEATTSALASRGALAVRLVRAIHGGREQMQELASDSQVAEWARRHRESQYRNYDEDDY